MHMQQSQESLARAIAEKAHADQVDKAGEPYIGHPAHVAASVEGDKAKAVAWLHDVVEDTSTTFDDLRAAGVDDEVLAALELPQLPRQVRTLHGVCGGHQEKRPGPHGKAG